MIDFLNAYDVINSLVLFLRITFVFVFFSGILLLAAPSVFTTIAQRLQEKHGVKKEMLPWLEGDRLIVDHFLYNHRKIVAPLIMLVALFLFFALH